MSDTNRQSASDACAADRDAKAEAAAMTDEQKAEAARLKAEADAQAKAEADKAKRAKDGTTGDPSGNPAGLVWGPRIEAAKFEHRNQGHDDTLALLDEMMAALQRVEAKLAGG